MTPMVVALFVAAGIAAAADWVALATDRRRVEVVTKPLVILLLIAAAFVLQPADPVERAWFLAALALSLVGDLLLLRSERWFAAGLGAFLLAHLAYIRGLLEVAASSESLAGGLVFVLLAGILLGVPLARGAGSRDGALMAAAVVAYIAVISITVVAAGLTDQLAARAGAVLLYASDGVIGWDRYLRPLPAGRLIARVPYQLGQALLTLSLLG